MRLHFRHDIAIFVLLMAFGIVPLGKAQVTVNPMPFVVPQFLTNSGQPCAGCQLASFAAGTSTPLATYSEPSGTFPNSNPVILDSAGRARIYLTGASYKLVLSDANGSQIWSVDQVAGSTASLLFSDNTWVGVNTFQATTNFNGPANFNVGLTSSGPNNLSGGGSMSGNWTGSPVFQGTPFFNNGFMVNGNATFNGAIISTVATGNAPFLVSSTTVVGNLDVNFLEGNDWASPAAIGGTAPQTGVFTQLRANASFQIDSGPLFSGTQGTDTNVLSAGTFGGSAGLTLCTDANGGATTTSCAASTKVLSTGKLGGTSCTPGSSSFDTCTSVITISPAQPDTNYIPSCTGQAPGDPRMIIAWSAPTSPTTITATVETMGSIAAPFSDIFCSAISNH